MKKLFVLLFLVTTSLTFFGQTLTYSLSGTTNNNISILGAEENKNILDSGKKIEIFFCLADPTYGNCYIAKSEGSSFKISFSDIKQITFDKPGTKEELWQLIRINSDLDESLVTKGYQYNMRKDMEAEATDALQNFEKYYGFFYDEYLEDYIQTLLYKIHSITLNDGRPGNLTAKILKTSTPNAFCLPTGTIILTTGLLSTIRSEDELIGILAHEVAHFVLDHHVVNINKAITRQKRAEFWSGFATVVAAASDAYLSSKHKYYPSGTLTLATAILSSAIATSINDRLGANYNINQEWEADNAATKVLTFLGKDPKALSVALSRIQDYCILNADYLALAGSGTHPALPSRIGKIGYADPTTFNSIKYDRIISLVNTYNSMNEYELQHLETTLNLTNRSIESGVGTEDDYLLKAMSIRLLYDTPEKNQEALDLINKAKSLNIAPHSYILKEEGLTLLRLRRQKEASEAFTNYGRSLESEIDKSGYVLDEIEWTKKMINKLTVL